MARRAGLLRMYGPLCVAIAIGVAALVPALSARSDAADHRSAVEASRVAAGAVRVIRSGTEVVRAVQVELVDRMSRGLVGPPAPPDPDASGRRLDAVQVFLRELESISETSDDSADDARRALDELGRSPLDEPDVALERLSLLPTTVLDALRGFDGDRDPEHLALRELASLTELPSLVADRSLTARIRLLGRDEQADPDRTSFPIEGAGGRLLGADDPLGRGSRIDIRQARLRYPDVIDRIGEVVSESGLVPVDSWVDRVSRGEDTAIPPSDVGDTIDMMTSTEAQVVAIVGAEFDEVLGRLADERRQAETDADRSSNVSYVLFAVAFAALVATIGLLTAGLRRSMQRARLATVDQLTGLGNRHVLDDVTTVLMASRQMVSHAVAVLDCDRFKLVNDAHGHEVGDRVLIEIADRLRIVATEMRHRFDARTTVVRLGGDEFLLSVHSPIGVEPIVVRAALEAQRIEPLMLEDGSELRIEFSIGVVASSDPTTLHDLMRDADLAVYEDKAARSSSAGIAPSGRTGDQNR